LHCKCFLGIEKNVNRLYVLYNMGLKRLCSIWLLWMSGFLGVQGSVISYWRFEVDNDPAARRLNSPNEIAGEPAVISTSGKIDDTANPGSLPSTIVPISGAPNTASLDGTPLDVNATAAYSSSLNVSSMTVELFARTEERTAVLIARTNTANPAGNSVADGFRIYDPQDLKVQYVLTDGVTTSNITIDTNFAMDGDTLPRGDGVTNWNHIAFTYDETTGVGTVYANGESIGSHTATVGSQLYWGDIGGGAEPMVYIGTRMDGYNFSKTRADNGFIDEIRFSNLALGNDQLLIAPVPEPGTWIAGLSVCLLIGLHYWRRKQA